MICCFCGKEEDPCFHCSAWGITDLMPTIPEQFHRIGKEGKRYWGKLGGGIVFTDGKQVLLLKRNEKGDYPGHWAIPGGKAKDGEVPIETARREAVEECGSSEGNRFGHFHEKDGSHHFHVFMYSIPKPFEIRLSGEHSDGKWVQFDEISGMKLHPKLEESWPVYLRAIRRRFPSKTSFSEWVKANKKLDGA